MGNETAVPQELIAARCVSFRELSRSTAELVGEIERDGKIFALSRYGRLVALLIPLPERLILTFEDGSPMRMSRLRDPAEDQIDLESLDLSTLACEFLIDASSTPTGFWHAPDSAFLADRSQFIRTLLDLDSKGLTEFFSANGRRITKEGRVVAGALRRSGHKGYGETHNDPYLEP